MTREELADNLASTDVKLSTEPVKLLDDASALPPECPGWMLEFHKPRPRGVPEPPPRR